LKPRIVNDIRLVDDHRAIVVNDVIADLTLCTLVIALDGAGLAGTRVSDGHVALVQDGRLRSARATVNGVAVQVERDLLRRSNGNIFCGVSQQLDGLAFLSRNNCSLKAGVPRAANLSDCRCNTTIRTIGTLDAGKSIGKEAIRNRLVEGATRYFEVIAGRLAVAVENLPSRMLIDELTTRNLRGRFVARHLTSTYFETPNSPIFNSAMLSLRTSSSLLASTAANCSHNENHSTATKDQ